MVTIENYEEYMMLYADGELAAAEVNELFAFVAAHPGLEQELKLYTAARLQPDLSHVFTGKESLLQQEETVAGKKRIALGWWKYAVAAGLILLLGLAMFKFAFNSSDENTVVQQPAVHKTDSPKYAAKASSGPFDDSLLKNKNTGYKKGNTAKKATVKNPDRNLRSNANSGIATTQSIPEVHTVETLIPAGSRTVPVTIARYESDIVAVANPVHISAGDNYKKPGLTIPQEKIEGFADRIQDVKNITNNLKGTALVFNLSKN